MNRMSKEKNPCDCVAKIVNNYDEVVTWDKPEWINSEIVKPPKDRAILVCVPGYQIDIGVYDEEKGHFIDYYHKQNISGVILYWMELPKLPE